MMIDNNSSRSDLEVAILSEPDLYNSLDEQKLMDASYTDEELRTAIISWIEAGDETK